MASFDAELSKLYKERNELNEKITPLRNECNSLDSAIEGKNREITRVTQELATKKNEIGEIMLKIDKDTKSYNLYVLNEKTKLSEATTLANVTLNKVQEEAQRLKDSHKQNMESYSKEEERLRKNLENLRAEEKELNDICKSHINEKNKKDEETNRLLKKLESKQTFIETKTKEFDSRTKEMIELEKYFNEEKASYEIENKKYKAIKENAMDYFIKASKKENELDTREKAMGIKEEEMNKKELQLNEGIRICEYREQEWRMERAKLLEEKEYFLLQYKEKGLKLKGLL